MMTFQIVRGFKKTTPSISVLIPDLFLQRLVTRSQFLLFRSQPYSDSFTVASIKKALESFRTSRNIYLEAFFSNHALNN